MTKFFLHGWKAWIKSKWNRKFFQNFLEDYIQWDRVLIIPFAKNNNLYDKMIFLKYFLNIFEWKIIAWSSAWVNILSKISFSNDYQSITKWLGLLDIGTMCHFSNKWIWKNMLEENNENDKSFFIKEEEYIYVHREAWGEYEVKQIEKPENS